MGVIPPGDFGYTRENVLFTFRQIGSLVIPKSVRERAFQMEVSIEIISNLGNDYLNFKSFPSNGFYGYATLVFYNYVTRLIPLEFGRNTIYFERNESAYAGWENFKSYGFTKYDFFRLTDVVGQLASNLGFTVTPNLYPSPDYKGFTELPLREVYVKCPYGTQFKIEVAYERALSFFDMDGIQILPKSKRPDQPKKDEGLPSEGIQPQKALDPTFPYTGFPSPSTSSDLGDWNNSRKLPSSDNSGTGIDKPNSSNQPDPAGTIYWIELVSIVTRPEFLNPCSQRTTKQYILLLDRTITGTIANTGAINPPVPNGCGGTTSIYGVRLSGGDGSFATFDYHDNGSPSINYGSGLVLPSTSVSFS